MRSAPGSTPGLASGRHRGDGAPGYDLQLTRFDNRGWRATFYTTVMEHSPTSATGSAWERTPWHAVQRAAWEALNVQFRAADSRILDTANLSS